MSTRRRTNLSIDDARKLDAVREALQRGDLKKASQLGHIYRLTPIGESSG